MNLPWCSTGTRRKLEVVHELNGLLAKTDLGIDNAFAQIAGPYILSAGSDQLAENQISEVFMEAGTASDVARRSSSGHSHTPRRPSQPVRSYCKLSKYVGVYSIVFIRRYLPMWSTIRRYLPMWLHI